MTRKGKTAIRIAQKAVPALPHERDEAAESKASPPRKVIERAASDVESGQQDTDRGAQTNRMSKALKN